VQGLRATAAQGMPVHTDLGDNGTGQQLAHPLQKGLVKSVGVEVLKNAPESVGRGHPVRRARRRANRACFCWPKSAMSCVNEKRVRRLVRLMGHEPVYPKPRLTLPGQGVTPYPYLLRERLATAPNEVWSTDITYVPMAKGALFSTWPPCSTGTRATC
jgi:hypothetical protein